MREVRCAETLLLWTSVPAETVILAGSDDPEYPWGTLGLRLADLGGLGCVWGASRCFLAAAPLFDECLLFDDLSSIPPQVCGPLSQGTSGVPPSMMIDPRRYPSVWLR